MATGLALCVALTAAACGGSEQDSAGDGIEALTRIGGGNEAAYYREDDAALGAVPPVNQDSAEAPADGEGSSGGTLAAAQLLDRKQILTATVRIEAENVSQKFEEVGAIALGAGGVVFSSSFGNDGDQQTASVTIRVPNDRYQETLGALRKLGTVKQEQSSGTDVTGEYTDLQSRLRNLQATEAQYLALLTQAGNINDILTVQDRINNTRAEIEQIQGRVALLDNQTDLSTITVHLFPPAVALADEDGGAGNPLEVAQEAFDASLVVLIGIATGALAVVAFSWWLIPLGAAGWYFGRKQLRANRERQAAQAPPPAAS
jgi:hypothetical protein